MKLLIVGSVAVDTIDTPFGSVKRALGGSATYASVASSYFTKTGIVGVVGNDFEKKHINLLKKQGVDLDGLQVDPSGKTFHWSGYYEGDMNEAITRDTELNVFEKFNPVIPDAYKKTPFVMLGNIHPALQLNVLEQIKKPRMVLCDTMNFWITSAPQIVEQVFRKVDIICINDGEAKLFCNTSSLPKAAAELLKLGAKRVIIKKGAHGVNLYGKKSFFSLPAIPLTKVKDPTGAGDSFAGGTIGYLANCKTDTEDNYRRGLLNGTVLASYCVENFSCRKTVSLKKTDINKRVKMLKEFNRIPAMK
ncbi:MAG: sugar kinase [Calditrichaeota bacterium]|nr:MAG: sugar kinase [Calditrichota bacterium]